MTARSSRFKFASAPNSWGVLDYPSPSWDQSYQAMLDEMVSAGYTGTELGPYGFFALYQGTTLVVPPSLENDQAQLRFGSCGTTKVVP